MAEKSDIKVRILPAQPHCFAFGGFDMQMLRTLDAARSQGVDVQRLDIWSKEAEFDILHIWGLTSSHVIAADWAHRAGKRVVMTPLLPFRTFRNRLSRWKSRLTRAARADDQLLALVDWVVVVSDAQAIAARDLFCVQPSAISVIPSVVETPYFDGSQEPSRLFDRRADFVLCTGNICARKNQLSLAQAAAAIGCPLVLIGRVLTGETSYGRELKKFISDKPTIEWHEWVSTPEMVAAYRNARAFALPSWNETQPASALEAAAAGKPVLLADKPYAHQSYYRNARLVNPSQWQDIAEGLRALLAEGLHYIPPQEAINECRPERVGAAYRDLYARVLSGG